MSQAEVNVVCTHCKKEHLFLRVGLGQILQICLKLEMLYTMNMALFKIFIYEAGCL